MEETTRIFKQRLIMKQSFVNLLLIVGIIFIHYMCEMAHTNWMYLFALLGGICIGFYTDCVYKKGEQDG